ncbi:MAG: hypothetical protein ACJA1B_002266, partial [Polaribacter sp.]
FTDNMLLCALCLVGVLVTEIIGMIIMIMEVIEVEEIFMEETIRLGQRIIKIRILHGQKNQRVLSKEYKVM